MTPTEALAELMLLPMTAASTPSRNGAGAGGSGEKTHEEFALSFEEVGQKVAMTVTVVSVSGGGGGGQKVGGVAFARFQQARVWDVSQDKIIYSAEYPNDDSRFMVSACCFFVAFLLFSQSSSHWSFLSQEACS